MYRNLEDAKAAVIQHEQAGAKGRVGEPGTVGALNETNLWAGGGSLGDDPPHWFAKVAGGGSRLCTRWRKRAYAF